MTLLLQTLGYKFYPYPSNLEFYTIQAANNKGADQPARMTTKVLISLRECAGWSAPLLFAYGKNRFSHDMAHIPVV